MVHISTDIYTAKQYQKTQCYGTTSHTKVRHISTMSMETIELVHLMRRVAVSSAQATRPSIGNMGKIALSQVQSMCPGISELLKH